MGFNGKHSPPYEADFDAPWWITPITALPNHARCETCRHWCGQCLSREIEEGLITRAEDRCEAWQQARDHETRVNDRIANWASRSQPQRSR